MPCLDTTTPVTILSKNRVYPETKSTLGDMKLSVSDLPMLSCHYIQKGCLFTSPPIPTNALLSLLKTSLSKTLSRFPPLAGRLKTDGDNRIYLSCNDAGVDFVFANAGSIHIRDILSPLRVPEIIKEFFCFNRVVSYEGHHSPILAVQVTELADGVFIGCSVNHAVTDGTSFWNFFNTFAEVARGVNVSKISRRPDFSRESVLISPAVLRIPETGLKVTFDENEPLSERIFSFSRESISQLKSKVNNGKLKWFVDNGGIDVAELLGKMSNDDNKCFNNDDPVKLNRVIDSWFTKNAKQTETDTRNVSEISSFQSLSALLWRAVTRARKLPASKTTTFRMAVNCRHRFIPKLDPLYFGNAIQSIPTLATAGEVLSHDLRWCAEQLSKSVAAHDDAKARRTVADWEKNPRCFPLGNFDGASMTMGSSPRFPMYENDFGWGRPVAVRSGKSNKFDGKISAFPGREGNGSVDLEVVLAPETMALIESDLEFMQYVSTN